MHIHRLEATFLWLAGTMMFLFAGAILISVFGLGVQLPGFVEQIDPAKVDEFPGFDQPVPPGGAREVFPGHYEAYITAGATTTGWVFTPSEITVPAGSTVTFFIASKDITHGFKILDTDVNIMIIPGQLSQVSHTFDEPGEYPFFCQEYCGGGHQNMSGKVIVTGEAP
jgi:cytochrome c oxidase subunit 2